MVFTMAAPVFLCSYLLSILNQSLIHPLSPFLILLFCKFLDDPSQAAIVSLLRSSKSGEQLHPVSVEIGHADVGIIGHQDIHFVYGRIHPPVHRPFRGAESKGRFSPDMEECTPASSIAVVPSRPLGRV